MSNLPHQAIPVDITVHQQSRLLEIAFDDGARFSIPFELLRVYSPSAEVQGHGPGQEVLQTGKRLVGLQGIEPVGNYAIKPLFDDGHESGLYTWSYLYDLGSRQAQHWAAYLARLTMAGADRDAPMPGKSRPVNDARAATRGESATIGLHSVSHRPRDRGRGALCIALVL
ncbi:MAG: hypothetical protein GAK30_00881 [Paracidovorax wautersii]|uniref:Gamma-butyrobetaine hydroxylase-like N-terminal domain-containing protein n=1 Tax=Paracidovorax wautersii TaxID=1177982 RepID=A0A7V8FR29_9BURK|nr:MAG: hypothetical protein GAK30_00881 [Paracidovorax wautersii]